MSVDNLRKLPIIGVMGGSPVDTKRADDLGQLIARLGAHLLTGGGAENMEAVADAYTHAPKRQGFSIGILPSTDEGNVKTKDKYPNQFVEVPIRTHLWKSQDKGTEVESRNHINALTPTAIIALNGAKGTASEIELAREYGKPVAIFAESRDSIRAPVSDDVDLFTTIDEIEAFLTKHLTATQRD